MKISLITLSAVAMLAVGMTSAQAQTYSNNFAFPDGPLVGTGGFTQNGTTATNPIQISGGRALLSAAGGQDAYVNFNTAIPATDGTFAYFGLTLNITSATTAGDYFAHFTNGLTNPANFSGRLAAQSTTGGFFLGYSESTNGGTTYGTSALLLNTDYRVVLRYGFVNGTLNDTGALFVAPVGSTLSESTAYVTDAYNGTTAEIGQFTGFQFRQGGATTAPALAADDLVVSSDFATAAAANPVPEPSTYAMMAGGLGLLLCVQRARRTARA